MEVWERVYKDGMGV